MDSSVRDLLDGDLRDLLTAYEGLKKALDSHHPEIVLPVWKDLQSAVDQIEQGIIDLSCRECYEADRKPYRMGLVGGRHFDNLCEPCAEKRSTKREPFGGVTTYRSDE